MKPLSRRCVTAGQSTEAMIDADASVYERERDLPKLLALRTHEIKDQSVSGTNQVIQRLSQALESMTQLARMRHWSYDFKSKYRSACRFEG
jgi:hypothetical protein